MILLVTQDTHSKKNLEDVIDREKAMVMLVGEAMTGRRFERVILLDDDYSEEYMAFLRTKLPPNKGLEYF